METLVPTGLGEYKMVWSLWKQSGSSESEELPYDPIIPTRRVCVFVFVCVCVCTSKRNKTICLHRHLHTSVHSSMVWKSQKNAWQEISVEATGRVQEKEIMVTCINVVGMEMEKMGRITRKIYKVTSNPDLWEE